MFNLKVIKEYVEERTGLNDISIKNRKRKYINARAVYFKLAVENTINSYEEIGEFVNKDHATVTHSNTKVFETIKTYDKAFYGLYEDFKDYMVRKEIYSDYVMPKEMVNILNKYNKLEEEASKLFILRANAILNMMK